MGYSMQLLYIIVKALYLRRIYDGVLDSCVKIEEYS
jgi:hypothetical protein